MPMFHFRFEVRPKPTHPKFGHYAGAMVSCWIQRETQDQAVGVARGWIADEDWTIIRTEHADLITRETQLPDGMQYFEQAEIDREVFVFFTSPVEAPEDYTNAS
jgi:hypothetical protein